MLLREPFNPAAPALPATTALPWVSVIVTIVLLNVAWTCAWPCDNVRLTFFDTRRAPFAALRAIDGFPDLSYGSAHDPCRGRRVCGSAARVEGHPSAPPPGGEPPAGVLLFGAAPPAATRGR